MAHSLSAKKRVRQNIKSRGINRARKSVIKNLIKGFDDAVAAGNVEQAQEQLRITVKKIDKVAAKSTLHKKTAARMKSKLAKSFNALKAAQ